MPENVTIQDLYNAIKRIEQKMVTKEDLDSLIDSVEIQRDIGLFLRLT